jgi:8-oxo-dGTP pyrophosphatase MutT (NUDIX family)
MKRVATVAVVHDGKLLMGIRRDTNRWTAPGGHLEDGEEPVHGAARELLEEAGIAADTKELRPLKSEVAARPDGTKMEISSFLYEPKEKPKTSMGNDPDFEVKRWHWVNVRGGLPKHVADKLHVPLERNVLMKGLGMEKSAFWAGFEKQAFLGPMAQGAKSLFTRAMGTNTGKSIATSNFGKTVGGWGQSVANSTLGKDVAALGSRAANWTAANPGKATALAAGGAFAAGRMSKGQRQPAGPQYPY